MAGLSWVTQSNEGLSLHTKSHTRKVMSSMGKLPSEATCWVGWLAWEEEDKGQNSMEVDKMQTHQQRQTDVPPGGPLLPTLEQPLC